MSIPLNDPTKPSPSDSLRARSQRTGRDSRRQYRVQKQAGAPLEATILTADGRRAVGECADLSVGGAGVTLPQTKNLDIAEGTKVRLLVQHRSRASGVEAAAEIVSVSHIGTTVRYGLRFESIAEVVQQVDSFYARWFNRRRSQRVMPDFTSKVTSSVRWSDGELSARVHDISMGGVGILATLEQVAALKDKGRVELSLTLPGTPLPIVCRARVVGMRAFTKNVLVGLEFEPNGGIERYAAGLQRYVDERQKNIAKFNEAMAQQPKRAS